MVDTIVQFFPLFAPSFLARFYFWSLVFDRRPSVPPSLLTINYGPGRKEEGKEEERKEGMSCPLSSVYVLDVVKREREEGKGRKRKRSGGAFLVAPQKKPASKGEGRGRGFRSQLFLSVLSCLLPLVSLLSSRFKDPRARNSPSKREHTKKQDTKTRRNFKGRYKQTIISHRVPG